MKLEVANFRFPLIDQVIYDQAVSYYEHRKFAMAIRLLKELLKKYPNQNKILTRLARCLYMNEERQEAIEIAKKVVEQEPSNHELLVVIGNGYSDNREYEKSLEFYRKALEFNPKYHIALFNVGLRHMEKSEWDLAQEYLNRAIDANPKYDYAWAELALIAQKRQNLAEADRCFQNALSIRQTNTRLWLMYGQFLQDCHRDIECEWAYFHAAQCDDILPSEMRNIGFHYQTHPLFGEIFRSMPYEDILNSVKNNHPFLLNLIQIIQNHSPIPQSINLFPWFRQFQETLWRLCESNPSQTSEQIKRLIHENQLLNISSGVLWL